jgi:hypothetical protein
MSRRYEVLVTQKIPYSFYLKDEENEPKNLDEFSRLDLRVELRHPQDAEDLPMLFFEIENVEYEED